MSARNPRPEEEYTFLSSNQASCGARTYLFFPSEDGTYEKTKERLRPDMEEWNEEIRRNRYQEILSGKRTVEEIVAQIRQHHPNYEPNMVPVDQLFEKE